MNTFHATHYRVSDDQITSTGTVETYSAPTLQDAVFMALYTHRLHAGGAYARNEIIICPKCGQIAVTPVIGIEMTGVPNEQQ